jgi:hypothetical protein
MISPTSVLHEAYGKYCFLLARTVGFIFAPRLWYRALHRSCVLQGPFFRLIFALPPLHRDPRRRLIVTWLMQSTLRHLVALGRPFPIPTSDKNLEVFLEARKNPNGIVLCSVHLPFIRLVFRHLVELGVPPTAVVADEGALTNGALPVWGLAESIPGFIANRSVLVKVRNILRRGGVIATLIDTNLGDPVHCNIFRLIQSTGARLVFVVTELQPDGVIMVEFFAPPDPFCLSDESVLSNVLALQSRTARILRLPSWRPVITALRAKREVPRTPEADFELDSFS